MEWHRLGEYIEACDERNTAGKYGVDDLLGVNNEQRFCHSKAKTDGIDFGPYKVVHTNDFAYNPARLDIGSIAKFEGDACIVSTLYEVFRVRKDKLSELMPEFLQVYFARREFARYVGFKNWGSAREYFWLDSMQRVEIPVPSIEEQRRVVEAWQGLRKMKEQNEQLAEPLLALCRSYLQECKKKYPMVELGEYIEACDERNTAGKYGVDAVRGISNEKAVISTKADMTGVSLMPYKLFSPNAFCYVTVTSRNGGKISIACNENDDTYIVSSSYEVFRVVKPDKLEAGYLSLLFHRPEFDRYARFHSWGSARETFGWADMCRVKIPLPPIEVQRAIVDVYRCANEAKKIAAEADRLSREICPALIQRVIKGAA